MTTSDERLRDILQERLDQQNVEIPAPSEAEPADGLENNAPGALPATSNVQHRHLHITVRTQQPTNNNNNNGEFPQQTQNLFHMRDRLFLALFFRVSLIYARAFPKTLRRLLEFCLLMQSILLLFILTYIHIVYNQTPITCLGEHKNLWPKDGILRVEITTDSASDYDIQKSYEKEERLRQRASSEIGHDDLLTMMLTADTLFLDKMVTTAGELIQAVTSRKDSSKVATETSESDLTASKLKPSEPPETSSVDSENAIDDQLEETSSTTSRNVTEFNGEAAQPELDDNTEDQHLNDDTISPSFVHSDDDLSSGNGSPAEADDYDFDTSGTSGEESVYFNKTLEEVEIIKMNKKKLEEETILKSSLTDFEMFANSVWLHDHAYIVEYALEYGFLRLSPETRQRLNIPVKIVTLDPSKEPCFGDGFSRFLLDNFLGYDDILMSSIKNLAESEDNKGYLRNVVTGEQFRFVPMWMARSAYIPALLIMLVFTVSISMLLRYSHHQIFVFIVDLLNNIEGVGAIHIPAAPLFTVILALVGMEAIMSEFFNDTSTAFYVILIVWVADQYDSVCSHTPITRTYWVRFFYLYHFAFYAYHYRFNGQYGGLALLVSWSFIQHSMIYFYHHYELPTILRQAQQEDDNDIRSTAHNNYSTPNSNTTNNSEPPSDASLSSSSTTTQTPTTNISNSNTESVPGSSQSQNVTVNLNQSPTNQTNNDDTRDINTSNSTTDSTYFSQSSSPWNIREVHHTQGCDISISGRISSPTDVSSSAGSQTDTSDDRQVNPVLLTSTARPLPLSSEIPTSGVSLSNNVINTSEAIGLNFNLNDRSASARLGLRLQTNLPREETTRTPQQHESDDDDELD